MTKLYVTNLLTLYPSNRGPNNSLRAYSSEDILVEKTLFGYREVFTKHPLQRKKVLEQNLGYQAQEYPYIILDNTVLHDLDRGETQFILDENHGFIREAEEKDAQDYIDRFEKSSLKRHYDGIEDRKRYAREERTRRKSSRKKAKQLVKERKNQK